MVSRRDLLKWTGIGLAAAATGCAVEVDTDETGDEASELVTKQDWSGFESRLRGKLLRPGETGYDNARLSYNPLYDDRKPAAVVQCANAADVQRSVEFARNEKLRIAARSGGHSYGGYSTPDRGVLVDLGALRGIKVNDDGTAQIGAGARLARIYSTLGAAGVCVPGGSCPTVGISGLTLGGGIGVLARKFGLTCDSLLEADVVLPDGSLKTVSAEKNADLYWGLRGGGGGNFGIVTSFKFKTHRAPNMLVFMLHFRAGSAADVLGAWQKWVHRAPPELWSNCIVSAGSPPGCRVGGAFLGGRAALDDLIDQLKTAAHETPTSSYVLAKDYLDAMDYFSGSTERQAFVGSSRVMNTPMTDPSKVATLLSRYSSLDLLFDSLGGAVSALASDATAFPHRKAIASVQIYKGCTAAGRSTAVREVEEVQRALRGIVGTSAYINYIDPNQADWAVASYGANLGRLQALAKKYDPDNLFGNTQGVGLVTSGAACKAGGKLPAFSGINAKFQELGGCASVLGAPTSEEGNCSDGRGGYRHYEHGSIYWSPQTDAHEVHGAIHKKWMSMGAERSRLGYPKTDEREVSGGSRSVFEHGTLTWSASTQTVTVA